MSFESSYIQTINEISELIVWSSGGLGSLEVIENMSMLDFTNYRSIFKSKYEGEAENKRKFIEGTFEFARKSVDAICKTIAGANGGKGSAGKIGSKNR